MKRQQQTVKQPKDLKEIIQETKLMLKLLAKKSERIHRGPGCTFG